MRNLYLAVTRQALEATSCFVSARQSSRSTCLLQVVVTGGSKGLGYALAEKFLDVGDHVVIAARTASACEAAAQTLQQQYPQQQVFHTTCDVSQPEQVLIMLSQIGDCVCNNTSISRVFLLYATGAAASSFCKMHAGPG